MILHLGVVDMPYTRRGAVSTGDVAGFLENKYAVMGTFYDRHQQFVAQSLEGSLAGTLENMLLGAPPTEDPFKSGTEKIEDRFRQFLDRKEMDGLPGIPTGAAKRGVSRRFKRKRGPVRPSFIDTGLYQDNFAAWVD